MAVFGQEAEYYDKGVWLFLISFGGLVLVQDFSALIALDPELAQQIGSNTLSFSDLEFFSEENKTVVWGLLLGPLYGYWRNSLIRIGFGVFAFMVMAGNAICYTFVLFGRGSAIGWHLHIHWFDLPEEYRTNMSAKFAEGSQLEWTGFFLSMAALTTMVVLYFCIRFAEYPMGEEPTQEN